MASRRIILILLSVLSAFIVFSEGSTGTTIETTPTTAAATTTAVTSASTPPPGASTSLPASSTGAPPTGTTEEPPSTTTQEPTTAAVDTEWFDDLSTVDYIIIGVTCGVCAGIILGIIIIVCRKRMRKGKEDSSALVPHGYHPEHVMELGDGVKNYDIEH